MATGGTTGTGAGRQGSRKGGRHVPAGPPPPGTAGRPSRRSTAVAIGSGSALVVAALVAVVVSGDDEYDYTAVCADAGGTRVSDDRCEEDADQDGVADADEDDRHSGAAASYLWYYLRAGSVAPAVGQRVSGGASARPGGSVSVRQGGVDTRGGVVARGGFGGSGNGSVGG